MVVNEKGIMITGRVCTALVMVKPQWVDDDLTLNYPDKEPITISVKGVVERNDEKTVR